MNNCIARIAPVPRLLRELLLSLAMALVLGSSVECLATDTQYISLDAAIVQLQNAFIQRRDSVTLHVHCGPDLSQEGAVTELIFHPALESSQDSSYMSGDYLDAAWNGHTTRVISEGENNWRVEFYDIKYRTTKAQEAEFESTLNSAIEDLDVWTMSDALKCRAIYLYITSHVEYDYDTYYGLYPANSERERLSYTAYSALKYHRAVCSGYAQLFYAMAHSVGLSVRIIHGEADGVNGWRSHAWNAVELDGVWYQLDCTWDEGDSEEEWAYFLKGSGIPKHRIKQFPSGMGALSPVDYTFSSLDYIPRCRFQDLSTVDRWYTSVNSLCEMGIVSGFPNGYTYSPHTLVTRGMWSVVLYRLFGQTAERSDKKFFDVRPEDYYWDAVQWAVSTGIASGYPDNSFRPNENISIEQALTMLYRYVSRVCPFTWPVLVEYDLTGVPLYAQNAVAWAISANIPLYTPSLSAALTRGQMAEIAYAAFVWQDTQQYISPCA